MSLAIKVEILHGTDTSVAAEELCLMAKKFGYMVVSDFNGCEIFAAPGQMPDEVIDNYRTALKYQTP
jgi:hypothetical protein